MKKLLLPLLCVLLLASPAFVAESGAAEKEAQKKVRIAAPRATFCRV